MTRLGIALMTPGSAVGRAANCAVGPGSSRIYVLWAVRKVKEFEILRNVIPISLCPMLDRIWTVSAHLANFTGALIKK